MQVTSNPSIIKVRFGRPSDVLFIMRTWLSGLYYGNEFYGKIDKEAYFEHYPPIIQKIISSATYIAVACLIEDEDVIVGYSVRSGKVLHYVYVKKAWRKLGVAKSLISHGTITTCTHLTKVGASLKPKEWAFNPFLIG